MRVPTAGRGARERWEFWRLPRVLASPRQGPVSGRPAWLLPFTLGGAVACGGDAVLTLGIGGPLPSFGDSGQRVRNINAERSNNYGATLTDDLLEIYFASNRAGGVGNADIWHAERLSRADPFDPPELVREVSSVLDDVSPAISADGLTLWVGSQRENGLGGLDVWRTTRHRRGDPWGPMEDVVALNSEQDDLPRPIGQNGLVMPLASTRDSGYAQTYLAIRTDPGHAFSRVEPLSYLWDAEASMENACLTKDGLLLFFKRAPLGQSGDLFLTWRSSLEEPFRDPIALTAVNSDADDRDPFLSADQVRFFFSSNRDGEVVLDIYATRIDLPHID
jgi:hypothetical protein